MQGALQKHLMTLLIAVVTFQTEPLAVCFATPHKSLAYKQGALQNATFNYAMCAVFVVLFLKRQKGCWTNREATPDTWLKAEMGALQNHLLIVAMCVVKNATLRP